MVLSTPYIASIARLSNTKRSHGYHIKSFTTSDGFISTKKNFRAAKIYLLYYTYTQHHLLLISVGALKLAIWAKRKISESKR